MLKRILFAMLPMAMAATFVQADDNVFNIDVASITDADVNIVEMDLDIDVDQLAADAGSENSEDAVEACFRRVGYRCGGWGRGYGYGGWNSFYRPCYNSWSCYRPCHSFRNYYCVQPHYHSCYVASPCYTPYWGCH